MGGEHGGRGTLMVHGVPDLEGAVGLGGSGLYVGGIRDAMGRVAAGDRDRTDFKFFFNLCKFGPGEMETAVAEGRWGAWAGVPRDAGPGVEASREFCIRVRAGAAEVPERDVVSQVVLRQDPTADKNVLWGDIRKAARAR